VEETYRIVRSERELSDLYSKSHIIEFLHKNLEQFRDPPQQIDHWRCGNERYRYEGVYP
jgi:hypothetical protein